ncbi:MAG: M23 family metallopeptidase, partial [Patescibacteria group bacterium]
MKFKWLIYLFIAFIIAFSIYFVMNKNNSNNNITNLITNTDTNINTVEENSGATTTEPVQNLSTLEDPIAEFKKRITLKPFGIYITPENSSVKPEKFTGYHTGVDVEYTDVSFEVPVYAAADGTVVLSRFVSGYGGTTVIKIKIEDKDVLALYGHLNPNQLLPINSKVKAGEKIGILGEGYTAETDFERKHLHFAIIKGNEINLKGYVNSKEELISWYNPL